jgi:glycerophosphoryl diester phosphodiesterase
MRVSEFVSLGRVVAVAHRGGSKLRPENTIAAFEHGLALGADAIECDVHLSRDGDVVIIHDPTLDRTTDATGLVVERTARELAEVDAGYRFGADAGFGYRGRGFGVPRLADVLERFGTQPVVIEIKGDRLETAERTLDVIGRAGAADRVIVGGFNQAVLDVVREHAPEIVTSASLDEARAAIAAGEAWEPGRAPVFQLFQVPFRLDGQQRFGEPFVRAARRAGLPVHAWIVDTPDDMRELLAWGVTGIISDRPDLAVVVAGGLL